jgi:RimJ/RimL family protein N-acetyltransferase
VNATRTALPIRTERLVLRRYEESDLDAVHAIHRREDVTRYLTWGPRSREEAQAMVDRRMTLGLEHEGRGLLLAIVPPEGGPMIGDVNLEIVSAEHRQGEIGYVIHPDHQGRGYATEAAGAMLRLGFESYDLHRIVGRLDARNEASARVLERLGMRREAFFRELEYFKGEWVDELVYAILADEWRSRA